jgi:tRNA (guanine-N7-)-methyltransferase
MTSPSLIYKPVNWLDRLNWGEVFARPAPIEVDIGCGKGAFLRWATLQRPDRNFLGVDRLLTRLQRVESKLQRAGVGNARLLRIEASYFVQYLVPLESVTAYHIYCPDPWPKRRHQARRLMNSDFIRQLHGTLLAAGVVNFSTDDPDYFAWAQANFVRSGQFTGLPVEVPPAESLTDFERQFLDAGKSIHRSAWQKQF